MTPLASSASSKSYEPSHPNSCKPSSTPPPVHPDRLRRRGLPDSADAGQALSDAGDAATELSDRIHELSDRPRGPGPATQGTDYRDCGSSSWAGRPTTPRPQPSSVSCRGFDGSKVHIRHTSDGRPAAAVSSDADAPESRTPLVARVDLYYCCEFLRTFSSTAQSYSERRWPYGKSDSPALWWHCTCGPRSDINAAD